jgi:hypothetical protein
MAVEVSLLKCLIDHQPARVFISTRAGLSYRRPGYPNE